MPVRGEAWNVGGGDATRGLPILEPVRWAEIRSGWRERRFDPLRQAVVGRSGQAAVEHIDRIVSGRSEPDEVEATLRALIGSDVGREADERRLLVVTHVYSRCLDQWERTDEYAHIEAVLDALRAAVAVVPPSTGAGGRRDLTGIIVSLSRCMIDAMGCENALSCSCCMEMGQRAASVVQATTEVLHEIDGLVDGEPDLIELVREDAATQRCYFDNLRKVASAVEAFVTRDAPEPEHLEGLLRQLDRAEREPPLRGDVFASELRAHRAALQAINDNAERDRLRIDEAEITYVYPFALVDPESRRPVALEELEHTVRQNAGKWELGSSRIRPADVLELALTDLWKGTEEAPVTYRGVSIKLPPLSVRTTAPEDLGEFDAEICLTSLGNHHLRIRPPRLRNAGVHALNQALRRGSESMGEEKLSSNGRRLEHGRLADYAGDVIHGLAARLTEADGLAVEPVREHDASFHVVLNAPFMSIQHPSGGSTPADIDSLQSAFGVALVLRPIQLMATALEEWARYSPGSLRDQNLMGGIGYTGDVLIATSNTTVLHMPATPDWMIREYVEMVAFVASMAPLQMVWRRWAASDSRDLAGFLSEEGGLDLTVEGRVDELYNRELRVLATDSAIRASLADAASSELFHRRADRDLLDRLSRALGVGGIEDDLRRHLDILSRQRQQLSALIEKLADSERRRRDDRQKKAVERQEEAERRTKRTLDFVLAIVAAASLAELFSWVNGAWGGVHVARWIELSALILLIVAMVYLFRNWLGGSLSSLPTLRRLLGTGPPPDPGRPRE